MVQYRRNRVPGGSYFFTVTLENRQSCLLAEHVSLLRDCFKAAHTKAAFRTDTIVILPDHLHAIWTLPPADDDYAARWQAIKATFTRGLKARAVPIERRGNGEHRLWQRRYWEHTLRDEEDCRHHVEYIWLNPVKRGQVRRVADWGGEITERERRYGE